MSLNIPLTNEWRIKTDHYNFILVRILSGGREEIEGYYSSIEDLISGFLDKKMLNFNSNSLNTLLQALKSLEGRLSALYHTYNGGDKNA